MRDRLTCPAKFMSCFLYILENEKGKHYTGITRLKPEESLLEHSRREVYSTKFDVPWKLIYFQEYKDYKEARQREKLKAGTAVPR